MHTEEYIHFHPAVWCPARKNGVAKNWDDGDKQEGDVRPNSDFEATIAMSGWQVRAYYETRQMCQITVL